MSKNLLIFAVLLTLLVGAAYFVIGDTAGGFGSKSVTIKGNKINLEIADNDKERQKGLSNRESLAEDAGMLFIFDKPDRYQFWMKDVAFPLDMIFLSDEKIVTIHKNVPPVMKQDNVDATNLTIYAPSGPVNRVLEIKGGLSDKYGLKEGDTIEINL